MQDRRWSVPWTLRYGLVRIHSLTLSFILYFVISLIQYICTANVSTRCSTRGPEGVRSKHLGRLGCASGVRAP